jgi:hypothetical protein
MNIPYKQQNRLNFMKSVKNLIHNSDARQIKCCLLEGEGREEEKEGYY